MAKRMAERGRWGTSQQHCSCPCGTPLLRRRGHGIIWWAKGRHGREDTRLLSEWGVFSVRLESDYKIRELGLFSSDHQENWITFQEMVLEGRTEKREEFSLIFESKDADLLKFDITVFAAERHADNYWVRDSQGILHYQRFLFYFNYNYLFRQLQEILTADSLPSL